MPEHLITEILSFLSENGPTVRICDLALFTLFMLAVFFPYALFKMLTTLGCLCPLSWKNDLNNVVGIDESETNDIKEVK